jgi:hypothetical protein
VKKWLQFYLWHEGLFWICPIFSCQSFGASGDSCPPLEGLDFICVNWCVCCGAVNWGRRQHRAMIFLPHLECWSPGQLGGAVLGRTECHSWHDSEAHCSLLSAEDVITRGAIPSAAIQSEIFCQELPPSFINCLPRVLFPSGNSHKEESNGTRPGNNFILSSYFLA